MSSSQRRPKDTSSMTSEEVLIPLLAQRSCHLPGNDWQQDWIQFMRNNHIVFGICLCHRLHPLEWWERIMALLGSVAVGCVCCLNEKVLMNNKATLFSLLPTTLPLSLL